jgi:murein DD-endopeptidase MepM/ murein hydrolase activator NlpD
MRVLGHGRSHTRLESELSWKKLAFPVLTFLVFPVIVAYAFSVSAFLGGIGDFIKVNTQERSANSQNIALLASVGGPELSPKDASNDVNTVEGSALLPDAGPSGGLADVDGTDADHGQISIYVVHDGDTFSSIAKMFGVSVNTILWANDLSRGAQLATSQTLVILPVSGVQYVVKKGDTVVGIAKKFKGDADEIRSYNGMVPGDTLDVGSTIIIPDGELSSPAVTSGSGAVTERLRNAGGPSYDGYYYAPLVSYRKTQGLHGWNGVDLVSYDGLGAFVRASAAGEVVIASQACSVGRRNCNGGYGNYIVIRHDNGTQTLYGHLKSVAVHAGDHVVQGQLIGYEGNTGRSTGPHVHFEVRGAKNPFAACPLNVSCTL